VLRFDSDGLDQLVLFHVPDLKIGFGSVTENKVFIAGELHDIGVASGYTGHFQEALAGRGGPDCHGRVLLV